MAYCGSCFLQGLYEGHRGVWEQNFLHVRAAFPRLQTPGVRGLASNSNLVGHRTPTLGDSLLFGPYRGVVLGFDGVSPYHGLGVSPSMCANMRAAAHSLLSSSNVAAVFLACRGPAGSGEGRGSRVGLSSAVGLADYKLALCLFSSVTPGMKIPLSFRGRSAF